MTQLHEGRTFEQLLEMVERADPRTFEQILEALPCETCSSEREISCRSYDGEATWREACPDCRKGKR